MQYRIKLRTALGEKAVADEMKSVHLKLAEALDKDDPAYDPMEYVSEPRSCKEGQSFEGRLIELAYLKARSMADRLSIEIV